MKLTINSRLGDLSAELLPDFATIIIEGIGKATLSDCNRRFGAVIINDIQLNPYSVEAGLNLEGLIKEKGVDIKVAKSYKKDGTLSKVGVLSKGLDEFGEEYESIEGFGFRLTKEQKDEISTAFNKLNEDFRNDFIQGKIQVKVYGTDRRGSYGSFSVDQEKYKGYKAWDLFYNWFAEELDIYEGSSLSKEMENAGIKPGDDVTLFLSSYLQELERNKQEKQDSENFYKAELFKNVESTKKTKAVVFNDDGDFESVVTVCLKSGNNYQFSCRNIEDFGLAINPIEKGGLAIEVEPFLKRNKIEGERANAWTESTTTGWVWSRKDELVEITLEEIEAYKVCKYLTKGISYMRM